MVCCGLSLCGAHHSQLTGFDPGVTGRPEGDDGAAGLGDHLVNNSGLGSSSLVYSSGSQHDEVAMRTHRLFDDALYDIALPHQDFDGEEWVWLRSSQGSQSRARTGLQLLPLVLGYIRTTDDVE